MASRERLNTIASAVLLAWLVSGLFCLGLLVKAGSRGEEPNGERSPASGIYERARAAATPPDAAMKLSPQYKASDDQPGEADDGLAWLVAPMILFVFTSAALIKLRSLNRGLRRDAAPRGLVVPCTKCGQLLSVPAMAVDLDVTCPRCWHEFIFCLRRKPG